MNVHEEEFIRAFIVPNKRDRYLNLFATKKGRRKLTDRLDHNDDLDARYLHEIPSRWRSVDSILDMLKQRGAPSRCYVISSNTRLDGQQMELKEALAETFGLGSGTVISCIPGELGYFEAEAPCPRYLLYRLENRRVKDI